MSHAKNQKKSNPRNLYIRRTPIKMNGYFTQFFILLRLIFIFFFNLKRIVQVLQEKIYYLVNSKGFSKYSQNTAWSFIEKIVNYGIRFVIAVLLARYLQPEYYGIYSYAVSYIGIFAVIANLGLDRVVVKSLASDSLDNNAIIGTALVLKLLGAALSVVLVITSLFFTKLSDDTKAITSIMCISAIFLSFNVFSFYFQAKVQFKVAAIVSVIATILSNGVKLFLIINGYQLKFFAYAVILDAILLAIALSLAYHRYSFPLGNLKFNRKIAYNLLQQSLPLVFSGVVMSLYMKTDQLMLMALMSEKDVGLYQTARQLSEAWYFVPIVFVGSLLPALVQTKKKSQFLYMVRLRSLYKLMIWGSLSLIFITIIISEKLILFLYGSAYKESSEVLVFHIWGVLFVSIGVVWSNWILIEKKNHLTLINNIAGLVCNVILNFILIRKLGIKGAAIATICAYLIGELIAFSVYRPRFTFKNLLYGIFFWKNY